MSKISSLFLISTVLICSGCASVSETADKYDRSRAYLQSDRYAAKPITVPTDLDKTSIDDYYPVPTIADQGDPKVPSLVPPKDDPLPNTNSEQGTIT